ncbi:phage virion morphogenesis protein [Acetobacter persici]|uniref:phage virion morphogenesis protein n=1 Tax=Acetobacter persici TaxID=1076596 RepID=UPI0020CC48A6|nr:phage virion morphogenesis protein [Acetobacter persici]MCP9320113.1 phage virion morphogenesis protein [Acetobacter persici]
MSVAIGMEWDGLHQTLGRIADIGLKPAPLLEAIGEALAESTMERFNTGRDPDGVDWESYAPLDPLYEVDKKGPGILVEGGHLRSSIETAVVGHEVLVGSPLPYAAVHQFGAIIVPKEAAQLSFMMGGHLIHAHNVYIPARPYLGISDEDRVMVTEELELALARAIGGDGGLPSATGF